MLKTHKLFVLLTVLVILNFAIPYFAKIDRFPFSNYPMYASPPYRNPRLVFLCGPQQQRLGRFLYPVHPRMAAYLSRIVAQRAGVPFIESPYLAAIEEKYRSLEADDSAELYFVRYHLNLESYYRNILESQPEADPSEAKEFDPCVRG